MLLLMLRRHSHSNGRDGFQAQRLTPPAHAAQEGRSRPTQPVPALSPRPRTPDIAVPVPTPLFAALGAAWFSPSVPASTRNKWAEHGGLPAPLPPQLLVVHDRGYLNIRPEVIGDLNAAIRTAAYVFVVQDDPVLHFISDPYLVPYDAKWVERCLHEGRLVDLGQYTVSLPTKHMMEAQRVESALTQLARLSPAKTPRPNQPPVSRPLGGIRLDREQSSISQDKHRAFEPIMTLDIPSEEGSDTHPAHRRRFERIDDRHPVAKRHKFDGESKDSDDAKTRYTSRPLSSRHGNIGNRRLTGKARPLSSSRARCNGKQVPPPITYMLDVVLPPGIRVTDASDPAVLKLGQDAVEQANESLAGQMHVWSDEHPIVIFKEEEEAVEVGEEMAAETQADAPELWSTIARPHPFPILRSPRTPGLTREQARGQDVSAGSAARRGSHSRSLRSNDGADNDLIAFRNDGRQAGATAARTPPALLPILPVVMHRSVTPSNRPAGLSAPAARTAAMPLAPVSPVSERTRLKCKAKQNGPTRPVQCFTSPGSIAVDDPFTADDGISSGSLRYPIATAHGKVSTKRAVLPSAARRTPKPPPTPHSIQAGPEGIKLDAPVISAGMTDYRAKKRFEPHGMRH